MRGLGSLEAWCWRWSRSYPISPDGIMYPFQQITQLCKGNKFQYWTPTTGQAAFREMIAHGPFPRQALRPPRWGHRPCSPSRRAWEELYSRYESGGVQAQGQEMTQFREKWHLLRAFRGGRPFPGRENACTESWKGKDDSHRDLRVSEGTLCWAVPAAGWRWGLETSSLGPDQRCVSRRWPERDAGRWGRGRGEMGIRGAVRWNWQIWWWDISVGCPSHLAFEIISGCLKAM